MQNFDGKVAFVTGGASGIGLGMARNFLAQGMKVVIADYSADHLAEARDLLKGSNAVHFVRVDVSDREALRAAAHEALEVFGKIHVLCNNAGVGGGGNLDEDEFDSWDQAIGINLGGVVNGCKIVVPIIKAQGEGGHVVNTASMAGVVPLPGMGAYSTAKYAVRGLTESLRMQLAPAGIGVSCLYPGATKSALIPVPDDDAPPPPAGGEGEMMAKLFEAMRHAMDPMELGAMVVEAIRENRAHICTHLEFLDELMERNRALENAFPKDQAVPDARRVFERMRRATADELLTMAAKS